MMGRNNNRGRRRAYQANPIYDLCACGKRGFHTQEGADQAVAMLKNSGKHKGSKPRTYKCFTKYHFTTMTLREYEKFNKR